MQLVQRKCLTQPCPLCKQEQDIIINGWEDSKDTDLGDRKVVISEVKGYSFCTCRNILYTSWNNISQEVYNDTYTVKYDKAGTTTALSRYISYAPIVCEHTSGRDMVEIGCINPVVLDGFKKCGFNTSALDIISHDFKEHENITGDFEKVELKKKFDVIWASHIFEHFKDPIAAVKKCYEELNPGGLLFVSMPDTYFIDWKVNPYQWGHWHLKEHHIMWNMVDFCNVLKEIGFEIVFAKRNYGGDFICITDMHILAKRI